MVQIKNCRNIKTADISIAKNKLNIKYGANGTGKSSLSLGIEAAVRRDPELSEALKPFSADEDGLKFEYLGFEDYKSVSIFNEKFVNEVVFSNDRFFKNSFNVFVRTSEYVKAEQHFESLTEELRRTIRDERVNRIYGSLQTFILNVYGKALPEPDKVKINKTSPVYKGINKGVSKEKLKEDFKDFSALIDSEDCVSWIDWHKRGESFTNDCCPFCGASASEDNYAALHLSDVISKNAMTHSEKIVVGIDQCRKLLSDERATSLIREVSNGYGSEVAEYSCLVEALKEADLMVKRFEELRKYCNMVSLANQDNDLKSLLESLMVDVSKLEYFKSSEIINVCNDINEGLKKLKEASGILTGVIKKQQSKLSKSIQGNESLINDFLKGACYPYTVKIDVRGDDCVVLLIHKVSQIVLDNPESVLSYGERNALSLMMFLFSAIHDGSDLIILDDPVTSYDGQKRYALLNELFTSGGRGESLYGHTVVLFTHDFNVVNDVVNVLRSVFDGNAEADFVRNENGYLSETKITRRDIQKVDDLYRYSAMNSEMEIIKLCYARRLIEFEGKRPGTRNYLPWNYLSGIFHGCPEPTVKESGSTITMTLEQKKEAHDVICKLTGISSDYSEIVEKIKNKQYMRQLFEDASCNYDKLQIARLLLDDVKQDNRHVKKILDESLHLDNDSVFRLDPRRYPLVSTAFIELLRSMLDNPDLV